jgi:23S rRNA (pseudouridine1915-N3)-methyltransferase
MPRGYEVTLAQLKPREAGKIREKIPGNARVVALDERGKDLTTRQFAALLAEPTAFVIGGADGLDPAIKKEAALLLRLSALTLPHALAQVVLCEQLYRAATLLTGHPYHRE